MKAYIAGISMRFSAFILIFIAILKIEVLAQNCSFSGFVLDESGIPIINAEVEFNGLKINTLTDVDGYFFLRGNCNQKKILKIKSLGFMEKEILVSNPYENIVIKLNKSTIKLQEFVISASRTLQEKNNVAVPVQIITSENIEKKGFVRLNEVLSEQAGLQVINDHGAGLQLQGLSSDYILFLVDGEPLIGRTAGTFDLARLSVGNIERIEIVKGPSSSLYGNEALAGVVNIITAKNSKSSELSLSSLVRTHGTFNNQANFGFKKKKFGGNLHFDRLSSNGYDLDPATEAKTTPSFVAYTVNPKLTYEFTDKLSGIISSYYFADKQLNRSQIEKESKVFKLANKSTRIDRRITPSFQFKVNSNHSFKATNLINWFETESLNSYLENEGIYSKSDFLHFFNRTEVKHDWKLNESHSLVSGVGNNYEEVEATRYDGLNILRSSYAFVQYNGQFNNRLNISPSSRIDLNSQYGPSFNPKIAVNYNFNSTLIGRASVGTGFKTPDFRQLLLNFTNPTAGYSVFGSKLAKEKALEMKENGMIEALLEDLDAIKELKPEKSLALNFGMELKLKGNINIHYNFFYNKISNLIEHAPIARKTNGENIYSYFNKNRVATKGVESGFTMDASENFKIGLGYQYLVAHDLDVLSQIDKGKIFRRNPETGRIEKVKRKDYGGLTNRSRHSGNFKGVYTNYKYRFGSSMRVIYRGNWGIGDLNGNKIIDVKEEYASGYFLINISLDKRIYKNFNFEAGLRNLMGTTSNHEPSLSGRVWFAGVQLNFSSKE